MAWRNDPEKRRRDQEVYADPEYVRNRALARKRAGGRCEKCRSRAGRLQCDHIVPVSQGGTHELSNLRMLCLPCHRPKSASEGGPRPRAAEDPAPTPRTQW